MILINGKKVEFKNFPNGETLLNHSELDAVKGWIPRRISFKYEDDSDLVKLTILKDYLDDIGAEVDELVIYYMPYSRMDRSENGSPFTLKSVSRLINRLNFPEVYVVEPHSDVTCAVLDRATPCYVNYDLINTVKKAVEFNEEYDYIVFPDAGAQKRYSKMPVKNPLIGLKHRNFETGRIESLEIVGQGNPEGTKAIIVDDLSSFGGTFVATEEALRKKGIDEVYLLVAHAENSIFKGSLFKHVDKIFTTDSIVTEHNHPFNALVRDKLVVFPVEELV